MLTSNLRENMPRGLFYFYPQIIYEFYDMVKYDIIEATI